MCLLWHKRGHGSACILCTGCAFRTHPPLAGSFFSPPVCSPAAQPMPIHCWCPFFLAIHGCCPAGLWEWAAWEECRMGQGGGMALRLLWATKTPMCWISGCASLKKNSKMSFPADCKAKWKLLLLKVDGVFYFSGICDVSFSDPVVAYFSGPFRVIIIQTPFCHFQKQTFLASVIITPTFPNVN